MTDDTRTDTTWDPAQYLRHADHRTRPFHDLLARVPDLPSPRHPRITDLGCGPGTATATLHHRWPGAHVTGVDHSPQMLRAAAPLAGPTPHGGTLAFHPGDAATWTPERPHDLVVSNAVLHWVPGHAEFFARWTAALRPGGVLAFQVPANHDAPSHTLLRELAAAPRWRPRLAGLADRPAPVLPPAAYLDRLAALDCDVDAWETTYLHVLPGDDPVLDWVRGTTLRPVLAALTDPEERDGFLAEYAAGLRAAYPRRPHGTVFPFRRVFVVARKRTEGQGAAAERAAGHTAGNQP
ncbi:trans-aconitate 2-methyltransferase [Streptomyces capparidis]